MAVQAGVDPGAVDVPALQRRLLAQGMDLGLPAPTGTAGTAALGGA